MKKIKVFFTVFIVILSLTKGSAQNLLTIAPANQEYANTYPDRPKFYADSTKWTIRFTNLNTDSDDFGPTYFKDGLIITSNRYSKQTKYSSRSKTNSFTDLYFIKDTNSIKKISLQGETNKHLNVIAMTRRKTIRPDVNNNNKIGNFYVISSTETPEISEAELTPATLQKGALKSKLNDGPLSFPADESWVMFTRNKDANRLQLFSASYTNEKWINVESFIYNSNAYSTGHPSLSADGKTLYFVSNMPGGYGGTDIYYCLRSGDSWTKPVNLGNKINTEGDEMFPFLDSLNNLYFSSNGLPGFGGLDIFHVLLKEYLPSEEAKNLGYPLNSNKDDFGIITANNGSSGYFSSDRRGNDDIYRFDAAIKTKDVTKTVRDSILSVPDPIAKATETHSMPSLDNNIEKTVPVPAKPVYTQKSLTPAVDTVNGSRISLAENIFTVTTISASDADAGSNFVYSLNGGVDMTKFRITSNTGVLSFIKAPDFERPVDADANNTYIVVLRASDGTNVTDLPVTVTITDANDNTPLISSGAAVSVQENTVNVATISAADADAGTTLNYSVSGGADRDKFLINSSTGVLTLISAPDFERPADSDNNNNYVIVVRASDGTNTSDQTIVVTTTDTNDNAPVITSGAVVSVTENTTAVSRITASDTDAGSIFTYSLNGGADVTNFNINSSTGALTFITAPDFEKPADADANNTYSVVVKVSDGINTADKTVTVNIADINDNTPVITSPDVVSIAENTIEASIITAIDADAGSTLTYTLSGGADAIKFRINSNSGALTFIVPPDFEKPADAGANNTYAVMIRASDGSKISDQTVTLTITNINDNVPVITSHPMISLPENTTTVMTIKATDADASSTFNYSISGGADAAKFLIHPTSGVLGFISKPDYEKPGDADSNNKYIVVIRVNDGVNNIDQTVIVTVTDINDNAPVINLL